MSSNGRKQGAKWMLESIRASLKARLEGRNEGGDIEVMRLVDEIVNKEIVRITAKMMTIVP